MAELTKAQRAALEYISGTMGIDVHAIGRYVAGVGLAEGGYQAIGTGLVSSLKRKGLVVRTNWDWRTTDAGRKALEERDG